MATKILAVQANNRKRAFEIRTGGEAYLFPYAKLDVQPAPRDRVVAAQVDEASEGATFLYRFRSGLEGSVSLEAVERYNEEPSRRNGELLRALTLEARGAVAESPLSKRELSRRLGTSTSQLYRLLDPAYEGKSIGQVLGLLHALDRRVELLIGSHGDEAPAASRRNASAQKDSSLSLLEATLDCTVEGIVVVDEAGRIVTHNRQFARIVRLPAEVLGSSPEAHAVEYARRQLEDPDPVLARIEELFRDPEAESYEVIRFRDGRTVECRSRPKRLDGRVVGRVWSFRDVTAAREAEAALKESEERYHHLFSHSREAIYVSRPDGTFVDLNHAALELFGFSHDEMRSLTAGDFYVDQRDRSRFRDAIERTGFVRDYETRLRARDGNVFDCRLTAWVRRNADGSIREYQGILTDVTKQKRAEEALRASEERFRSLIENAMDTITILDREGRITYESPSIARVLGYDPDQLVGKNVFAFVHPDDQGPLLEQFHATIASPGQRTSTELRFLHADGSWRMLECVGHNLLDDPAVGGVVVNARDVTARKEAERQLLHDAFHDKLTGLPNRALFLDRLTQLLKRSRRPGQSGFAVLFLDVDRFKVVNDSLGHSIGDELLVRIARRLESCLRPDDTVARLGGDEFTILVDGGDDVAHVTRMVERIQAELRAPFRLRGREVYVTASIGIAVSTPKYNGAEEILRDADTAMYRAKAGGPARHALFDTEMHHEVLRTLDMEAALRRAVERDEFRLDYQPIVALEDGRIEGFEALLRWRHPEHGRLLPSQFLGLAEETGLIVPIGRFVFEKSCAQLREWSAMSPAAGELGLSLNLSARELTRVGLVERMEEVLSRTRLDPGRLTVELTESTLVEHAELTLAMLERLKDLGVRLAVDDFGTGYSSLSYLHNFPIDVVKIDRSFIARIGETDGKPGLVRAITALALDLGLRVVAEGVETAEQRDVLRGLGCHAAQGHFFHPPATSGSAARLIGRTAMR